jgi:hypothetical protein
VVQGGLDDPANNRAHMKTEVALDSSMDESVGQLHAVNTNLLQDEQQRAQRMAFQSQQAPLPGTQTRTM